jgi:hypothetical protein
MGHLQRAMLTAKACNSGGKGRNRFGLYKGARSYPPSFRPLSNSAFYLYHIAMDSISFYRPQLPSLNNRAHPTALYQNHGLVTVASQSPRSNRDGFSGGNFQARTFQELNSYWSQRDTNNGSTAMVACKSLQLENFIRTVS